MPRDPPKSIITDQDPAMKRAIKTVLPNACHRFCLWHILDRLNAKLKEVAIHSEGLVKDIKDIVYNADTKEEFELQWEKLVVSYKVVDNMWLNELFEIREKWVPIYLQGVLFVGMRTTQRSESINSVIKQLGTQKNGMYDFVLRLERPLPEWG